MSSSSPNALDQLICGIGAGTVSTLFMHPLDLLKVRFQVATKASAAATEDKGGNIARQIWTGLKDIVKEDGARGLYRGLSPNLLGNASSWGLYFLFYALVKSRKSGGDEAVALSSGQHLAASAEAGVYSTVLTNPIWVVKTRMFTSKPGSSASYQNVFQGLYRLAVDEGARGMGKGMLLACVGISNGAIQFTAYERLKAWRIGVRRRKLGAGAGREEARQLSNWEYIAASGTAKLCAICITYPYQVIRSRIQYRPLDLHGGGYTSIPDVIRRTYAADGLRGFYQGLPTNAVRILPGTCVTFVVYEQLSRWTERRRRKGSIEEVKY